MTRGQPGRAQENSSDFGPSRSGSSRLLQAQIGGFLLLGLVSSALALVRVFKWGGALAHLSDSARLPLLLLALLCLSLCSFALAGFVRFRQGDLRALDLRVAILLLGLGSFSFTFLAASYSYSWVLLWGGVLGAVYSLWVLNRSRWHDLLESRTGRWLDVGLFNLTLTLVLLQFTLHFFALASPRSWLSIPRRADQLLEQMRCPPGTFRFGFPCNSLGYYDDEPGPFEGPRIALVGDSFALGIVPHALLFTTVAERLTGYRIDTFGVARTGLPEYRLILQEDAIPQRPDAIVIALYLGNDIQSSHLERGLQQGQSWLRFWLDRNRNVLWRLAPRLGRIAAELWSGREGATLGKAAGLTGNQPARSSDPTGEYPWTADYRLEKPTFSRSTFLEIERTQALAVCGGRDAVSYSAFFEDLEALSSLSAGVPFSVVLIPDEFQVEDVLWEAIESSVQDHLTRDFPQRTIRPWLEARQIPYLDLLPAFRAISPLEDGSRHLYHLQNSHLNTRGNRVAGEQLARFLRELVRPSS